MFLPSPKNDNSHTIRAAFPESVQDAVDTVLKNYIEQNNKYHVSTEVFCLEYNERISVPSRIHTGKYKGDNLEGIEKLIYDCVYSRSTDGYAREAAVKSLYASRPLPSWAIPYLYLALADYVIEVSSIIKPEEDILTEFKKISGLNPGHSRLTRERAISYWAVYYRYDFRKDEYPAFKVLTLVSSRSALK